MNADEDGLDLVLQDAEEKLNVFMGHTLRCHFQQNVLASAEKELEERLPETHGILTLD